MDTEHLRADLDAFIEGDAVDHAFLSHQQSSIDPDDPTPAEIDGLLQADNFLRRLRRLERDADDVRTIAAAEYERIKAWEDDRIAGIERYAEWLERTLTAFGIAYGKLNNVRTIKLPCGTIRLRKGRDKMEAQHLDVFAEWARETHPEWLKVTTEARVADVKSGTTIGPVIEGVTPPEGAKLCSAIDDVSGEVVPGVVYLVPVGDTVSVTPNQGDAGEDDGR